MEFPYIVRQNLVITGVSDPYFAKADHSVINLTLLLADAQQGVVEVAFAADPTDIEEHGRLLHAYALTLTPAAFVVNSDQLFAAIAERRWQAETGGLYLQGTFVNTEDRSKTLLNGSALKAMRNPAYVLRWKTPEGFVELTAEQVLYFADAVADFVQACFDREEELQLAVVNNTYTDSMLHSGWPTGE